MPGQFTVTLASRVGGVLTPLAPPQTFTVESLGLASMPEKDRAGLLAFQQKAGELQRAMMGASGAADEALRNIRYMKKALVDTPRADPRLSEQLRAIEKRLREALTRLQGDRVVRERSEASAPSLMDRVSGQLGSTSPITGTVKRDYEIAADGFEKLLPELKTIIDVDLRKLGEQLEAAGAPWTPGRGVPDWKK